MENYVVFVHAILGAAFVMTMTVMQGVVGPAMKRMANCPDKALGAAVIQARAQKAMDIVIALMIVTVLYMLHAKWELIRPNPLLHTKISFGLTALTLAALLHFYWRGKKRRLKEAGETARFESLSRMTLALEKVVLACAWVAFLLAIGFNHL